MKKLLALASMMIVVSVSAQKRQQSDRGEGRGIEFQEKSKEIRHATYGSSIQDFYKYDLSASQKRRLELAYQQHLEDVKKAKQKGAKVYAYYQSDFDKKVEKILSKKQLAQYKRDQQKQKRGIAYYQPLQIKKHR